MFQNVFIIMRTSVVIIVILFCQGSYSNSQTTDTSRLKLVFAGDIMGHDEQITSAWNAGVSRYDYEPTFRYLKPYIEQADISIANLEVTLAGPPYKGYPQFSSPDALALAARDAGFDMFIQANNHALDRGSKGFNRTIQILDSFNIIHTGTFADSFDRALNYPLIVEKNDIRIALLNYTYGTNGIKISRPAIINYIDTALIRSDLKKASIAAPDFTIVTIHWGEEYQRTENRTQQKLAEFMLKHGADAIIGSHPHVVQPVKYHTGADSLERNIVVYSQGNFVSNQRAQYKDGGILVELNLLKAAGSTEMEDFSYMPAWVYRDDLPGKSTFYVIPVSFYETNTSFFNLKDYDRYKITQFAADTREHLKNIKENDFFNKPNF
jgi:poly-gamma-glutamate capsule biosynthesis protein CapA/YwtB (metallophosphatase superfamily)